MKTLKLLFLGVIGSLLIPVGAMAADTSASSINTAARDQRIQTYIATFPVKLTDKEKTQLMTTCTSAQSNLQKIYDRLEPTLKERTDTYSLIDDRLSAVQKRLGAQQLDTSAVDLLLANYRKQTDAFDTALTTYRRTLQDAATMDCKSNPTGFRSSIEAVRLARKYASDSSLSIHSIATTDVKTTFELIKKRLSGGS